LLTGENNRADKFIYLSLIARSSSNMMSRLQIRTDSARARCNTSKLPGERS